MKEFMEKLESSLKGRIFLTTKDLVQLGIFGSKKGVYLAIKNGLVHAYSSDQRLIFHRDSVIEYLKKINK